MVVPVKTIFQGERVGNLELFPGNDATCAYLVRFYFEAAVFEAKDMCFLGKYAGEKANDSPGEEASVGGGVAAVEEGILLFGVTVEVAVNPYLSSFLFCEYF